MKATAALFVLLILLMLSYTALINGHGWPVRIEKNNVTAPRPDTIRQASLYNHQTNITDPIFPHQQANRFLDAPIR